MAELIPIAAAGGELTRHVIFIHGLGGHALETWTTSRRGASYWLE